MRHALRFLCPYVLGILVLGGCGESGDSDAGGAGGSAGMGGVGGSLGCTKDDDCDDLDVCTADTCNEDGICDYVNADDGTQCLGGEGSCVLGVCRPVEAVFACTEQGIRAAIAAGGGPNGFSCDGPQTVTTEAEIIIITDVILDGLGNLTVDGNETHTVFSVAVNATAELRRLGVTRGSASAGSGGGIRNSGTLTLLDSTVTESSAAILGGGIANSGFLRKTASTRTFDR